MIFLAMETNRILILPKFHCFGHFLFEKRAARREEEENSVHTLAYEQDVLYDSYTTNELTRETIHELLSNYSIVYKEIMSDKDPFPLSYSKPTRTDFSIPLNELSDTRYRCPLNNLVCIKAFDDAFKDLYRPYISFVGSVFFSVEFFISFCVLFSVRYRVVSRRSASYSFSYNLIKGDISHQQEEVLH